MIIPPYPIKRSVKENGREGKELLQKPFSFLKGHQSLFSCAREALFHGIKLLETMPDTAHVPAYCCRSVLAPLESLGIKVVFYDVDDLLKPVITDIDLKKNDLFLLVHFFGMPQETLHIKELCEAHNAVLVEDCAHTLPDPGDESPMGSSGSFSIFSLRKMLPVPDGGILVINDPLLSKKAGSINPPETVPISLKRQLINGLDRLAFRFGRPNTLVLKDIFRDKVTSTDNVFMEQLSSQAVPRICSNTISMLGNINMGNVVNTRRDNYRYLINKLSGLHGLSTPFAPLPDSAVPKSLPILSENVDHACDYLRRKGIGVIRWPWPEVPDNISWPDFPGASFWIGKLLLIPVHQDLETTALDIIADNIKGLAETG